MKISTVRKEGNDMNADLNFDYRATMNNTESAYKKEETCNMDEMKEMGVISEKCNCSGFSLSAIGGAILMFAGILIYTLVVG
jgi:hypothetical protein